MGIEFLIAGGRPCGAIAGASVGLPGSEVGGGKGREVDWTFAGGKVDSDAAAIDVRSFVKTRLLPCLARRGEGELGLESGVAMGGEIAIEQFCKIKFFYFCCEVSFKSRGIEASDGPDS